MSAQQDFDNKYISSTEICQELGVHRTTVLHAMRAGRLPEPIILRRPNGQPQIMLWERVAVAPYYAEWSKQRAQRASA